jgi:hypothetical protein
MGFLNHYYVRNADVENEREFVNRCYQLRIRRSNLINQWRNRWLQEQRKTRSKPKATDDLDALEHFLITTRRVRGEPDRKVKIKL